MDVIEAGFPAASPDDLEGVRRIAIEVGNPLPGGEELFRSCPVICGLARASKVDIDKAWEAIQHAAHPCIHTFLATSPIHMRYKLRMDPEEVVDQVTRNGGLCSIICEDVEFSPEDAGRSEPEFLYLVLGEAIKAGASTINIPDTVGYTTPDEFGGLIEGIIANTPGLNRLWSQFIAMMISDLRLPMLWRVFKPAPARRKSPSMVSERGPGILLWKKL